MNYKVYRMPRLKHIFRTLALSTLFGAAAFAGTKTQLVQNDVEPFGFEEQATFEYDHLCNAYARQLHLAADPQKRAAFDSWLDKLEYAREKPLIEKIQIVTNAVNNGVRYTRDSIQNGTAEYYASPIETIVSGRGDCEDYAIAKYYVLRWLGVEANRLYLASVTREGAGHSVLLVDTTQDLSRRDVIVMDNGPQNSRHKLGETKYSPRVAYSEAGGILNLKRVNLEAMKP